MTTPYPIAPPIEPMLAKLATEVPDAGGFLFEPKWDGFRAIVFRGGGDAFIQSRDLKPLDRYFPEVHSALVAGLPDGCVLDGEIVIAKDGDKLDFELLQMRLHPAASRVKLLATETPASIVFFDMLCEGDRNLCNTPFHERRAALESILADCSAPLHLTPATRDRATAADWFGRFEGAGLDGVIAKAADGTYEPNKRVMLKVKHERECDCVVAGFRWHKNSEGTALGSLLLGLFDDNGILEHVGVCASFTAAKRRELITFLEPYRANALENHPWRPWAEAQPATAATRRRPGEKSRWSQGKDLSWEPLRPELVVQVAYDHMQGTRFRHTAQFRRWRTDKRPSDCTFAQLEVIAPQELTEIFGAGPRM